MEFTNLSATTRSRRRKKQHWTAMLVLIVVCTFIAGIWWTLTRPTVIPSPLIQESLGAVTWPTFGQSAVGIVGSSTVETHGAQTRMPTASTAKLITALVVLQAKPLSLGQSGPVLVMSRNDIALLNRYIALDGSKIGKVLIGERLSEYQMLESMMLPSADNMADSLAIWAYGSLPAYSAAANAYLVSHGLTDTHVGTDASGLDPSTVSTAHDMVIIGELAMQNHVLAEIVEKQSVGGFPSVGTIKNTDTLLGQSGIVGIKTGNSDQQGGAFVGAANVSVNGQTETIVTALYGAPDLTDAMNGSLSLIKSVEAGLK
ncbi:MAG: serine hydrolase [Patescibacteria group bacterium]|nr:serine hydrolase [Patescibacteria group bacterium]